MGLDNYFLIKNTEENAEYKYLDCPFKGDPEIHLVGGMLSGAPGSGSFRGKFYSDMVDAILSKYAWLYSDHDIDEIRSAWDTMKPFYENVKSDEGFWDGWYAENRCNFTWDYTKEHCLCFLAFFSYYATEVDNPTLILHAWY